MFCPKPHENPYTDLDSEARAALNIIMAKVASLPGEDFPSTHEILTIAFGLAFEGKWTDEALASATRDALFHAGIIR